MDLWVRSQDRECLIKIKNISIDNENWVLGNLVSDDNKAICDYWKLGHYKTRERALEVLDEIQDLLQPKIIYHQEKPVETIQEGCYQLSQKVNMEFQELSIYVYEMPKE